MDSLTQIVLGAAVGEIILGRKIGNKAMLLGAIGGTLPDMDIIYNFFDSDPIRQLQVHRGYSHSMFIHLLVAWPLAWISAKWNKAAIGFKTWYLFWFLCFLTHTLLDCCTTYGTQLLQPFTNYQVAFNNISVIDPLFTIPFLLILATCLFFKRESTIRRKLLKVSLVYSSIYMLITFGLKYVVHAKFKDSLGSANIEYTELNSTPTILNSILWSGIAFNDTVIYVSEFSFLKKDEPINWISYDRNQHLILKYDSPALQTIKWFSDGNYFMQTMNEDTLAFYNVKFGRMRFDTTKPDDAFFFYWKFYIEDDEVKYVEERREDWSFREAFAMLMERIGV